VPDQTGHWVAVSQGGLASSSTEIRRWMSGKGPVHHIVDPTTGFSSSPEWALVTACGATCVEANALTTAAFVWGRAAPERLQPFGQAVRLVRQNGAVITLGGWPEDSTS
jgi:thiamine biosynthesis lipoprotein